MKGGFAAGQSPILQIGVTSSTDAPIIHDAITGYLVHLTQ